MSLTLDTWETKIKDYFNNVFNLHSQIFERPIKLYVCVLLTWTEWLVQYVVKDKIEETPSERRTRGINVVEFCLTPFFYFIFV